MMNFARVRRAGSVAAIACAAAVVAAGSGSAQDYPNKPITWIAPSSPGGGFDVVSRIIAPKLSEVLGQSVVVQNIDGAGATIGAAVAAEAAPDGYTILLANSNHTTAESLYKKLNYNVIDSFDPVVRFTLLQQVFIVNPKVEAQTLADLIALAKARPGELNMAHAGVASPTFMCAVLFEQAAGVDVNLIPYAGGGQALTSVVSGETDFECAVYSATRSFIEDGTVRGLAITSKDRIALDPDLPAASETLPGFEFLGWYGLLVPKGTPLEIREKIRSALMETLEDPATKQKLSDLGMEPFNEGPDEFAAYLKKEVADTRKLVEAAGVEPQ